MKWKSIYFWFMLSLVVVLGACSSDDSSPIKANELSNTEWVLFKEEGFLKDERLYSGKQNYTISFYEDEDGRDLNADYRAPIPSGEWTLKGGKLTVTDEKAYSGMDPEVHKYKVISVTEESGDKVMILREEYEDDEYDYILYYLRFERSLKTDK